MTKHSGEAAVSGNKVAYIIIDFTLVAYIGGVHWRTLAYVGVHWRLVAYIIIDLTLVVYIGAHSFCIFYCFCRYFPLNKE